MKRINLKAFTLERGHKIMVAGHRLRCLVALGAAFKNKTGVGRRKSKA